MIVAFDAKRAAQNRSGLGNYSRFVIEGLTTNYEKNSYLLYTPSRRKAKLLGNIPQLQNVELCYPDSFLWKKIPSLWRTTGITHQIQKDHPDIYHGLSNELPLGIDKLKETKSIVTIHDLIFLRYPQFYRLIDRNIYTRKFKYACQKADCIVAVSECTKQDIIKYFHISENKIKVIYQGCDKSFQQEASPQLKEEARTLYGLPDKYLLYVGSIESRKNLLLIVKALKHAHCDLPIVAIGKHTAYADLVKSHAKELGIEQRLLMLHNMDFKYFPAVYQMASLFIYPSFFEGFGIPILEALYSGIPVIGATGSCLEEAGGPDSKYINPNDEKELALAIDYIIDSPEVQQEMILKGKEYAKLFDSKLLADNMMELYQSLL